MSKAFENFMEEYRQKQAGCYGTGEPTADDGIEFFPQAPRQDGERSQEGTPQGILAQDSCGSGASEGKASDDVRVEGLGAGTVVADNSAKTAVNHAQSSGSESQQNCAGLGAEWGIPPAGMKIDPNMEALILAQTRMLLSRSLAYVGMCDLKCARQLSVEIRDHLEAVDAYAFSKGIAWEVAEAMLKLIGTAKA